MAEKTILSNHSVNRQIRNILKLYDDTEFREKLAAVEPELRSSVRAIELFVRQLSAKVSSSSDQEVSQNGLRQIDANLQNVWNELNAFQATSNAGHLTNATDNLDGALTAASWAFFARPSKGSRVYGESVASVQKAAEGSIAKLQSKAGGVASRFTAFENKLEGLEKRAEGSEGRLAALSGDADAQLAEIRSEFASIKTEIEQERQQDRDARGTEFAEFFHDQKAGAEELTNKIIAHEAEARKILQIVGNIGLTGNFQKRSIDEGKSANFWRWATIALFALGIGLITVSLLSNIFGNSTLDLLFIRLAIGIAITLPAIYTARESARHRTNADQAKQTELELASLRPFIEGLPEEDRWKIVSSLTPKYFGSARVVPHESEIGLPTDKLLESFDKLIERVPKG